MKSLPTISLCKYLKHDLMVTGAGWVETNEQADQVLKDS